MSVSEQEAKQQIAQMREALVSMKRSARRASYVRTVGVIVGFGIVGIYVYLFLSFFASVAHSKQFRPIVEQRLQTMSLGQKAMDVVKGAVPKYMDAGKAMLQTVDMTPVEEEGRALLEDLRPLLLSEMDRVWPKLEDAIIVEGHKGAEQLQTNLQNVLDTRMKQIVDKHTARIQAETGLTEAQTHQVVSNIVDAGQQAMLSMVSKRWKQNEGKLEAISDLVDRLPALPPMTEAELLEHTHRTLIALVKYKLPDYDLEKAIGQKLTPTGAPSVTTSKPRPATATKAAAAAAQKAPSTEQIARDKVKNLEDALKQPNLTPQQRQNIQKALDEAKADLNQG